MPEAIVSRATQLETPSDGQTVDDVENMALINQLANTPLSRGQVYIRSMYLCSSQLCESDWCRFTTRALDRSAERWSANRSWPGMTNAHCRWPDFSRRRWSSARRCRRQIPGSPRCGCEPGSTG